MRRLDGIVKPFILPGVFLNPAGILFCLAAAMATVLGGFLVTAAGKRYQSSVKYFMAVGAGFLLSLVFVEVVPTTFQTLGESFALWFLGGYLVIHLVERAWVSHFHFGEEVHPEKIWLAGAPASAGLALHSFFDGVSIAAATHYSLLLGALMFVAISLHKLPEGFTVASLNLAAGHSEKRALGWAGVLGLATMLGMFVSGLLYEFRVPLLAFSGGVALYVAATDLVPEVNRERGAKVPILVFAGVLLFYLTEQLLHHWLEV
ncbi:MAG: ZIP family metal transporter [Limisphaerales bacterium]